MPPIRALLLDLGDTLFKLHPMPPDIADRVSSLTGLPPGKTSVLVSKMQKLAVAEPGGPEADLELAAAHALTSLGLSHTTLADVLVREFHLADVRRFEAAAGLAATINELKAPGVSVCAVSNTTTSPRLLRSYLAAVGIERYFDAFVFSVEVGVKKPHKRIYEAALQALAARPAEALFVGDRVREDVVGPTALGMSAVLTHQFRQEDPGGIQPLAIISRLEELTPLIHLARIASDE
jgi:HAD superfamily hydrolase (TIGR01509 family)